MPLALLSRLDTRIYLVRFNKWIRQIQRYVFFRKWICFFFRNEFTFFFLDNSFSFGKWVAHYRYVFGNGNVFFFQKMGMLFFRRWELLFHKWTGILILESYSKRCDFSLNFKKNVHICFLIGKVVLLFSTL